jgi:hypothetical protein
VKIESIMAGFEDGEKGHELKEHGHPLEMEKEVNFHEWPPQGTQY